MRLVKRIRLGILIAAVFIAVLCVLAPISGRYLVVDQPQRSDLMVILMGDENDTRFLHGLELLRAGYTRDLVLDATKWVIYGRHNDDLAREYLQKVAPDVKDRLHVCSFKGNSTLLELQEIRPCLHQINPQAKTALLVTSSFHTRRAVSIARVALPEYQWSVAGAEDRHYGQAWWTNREWAKTFLTETQKTAWWQLCERWFVR